MRILLGILRSVVVGAIGAVGISGDFVGATDLSNTRKRWTIGVAMMILFALVQLPDVLTGRATRAARRQLEEIHERLEDLRRERRADVDALERTRVEHEEEMADLADLRLELESIRAAVSEREQIAADLDKDVAGTTDP